MSLLRFLSFCKRSYCFHLHHTLLGVNTLQQSLMVFSDVSWGIFQASLTLYHDSSSSSLHPECKFRFVLHLQQQSFVFAGVLSRYVLYVVKDSVRGHPEFTARSLSVCLANSGRFRGRALVTTPPPSRCSPSHSACLFASARRQCGATLEALE